MRLEAERVLCTPRSSSVVERRGDAGGAESERDKSSGALKSDGKVREQLGRCVVSGRQHVLETKACLGCWAGAMLRVQRDLTAVLKIPRGLLTALPLSA